MSVTAEDIAMKVKKLRISSSFSQKELAELASIGKTAVFEQDSINKLDLRSSFNWLGVSY